MLICLVGGAVRDMLLGRPPGDRDFLVLGATTAQFSKAFPDARQVGKAFPVFLVDGEEYAFPRGDGPLACCGGTSCLDLASALGADLESRDFTVNALALPLPDHPRLPSPGTVRDQVLGLPRSLDDLDARLLRPAGRASLTDDPLRVFRAARLLAQMPDFQPHPDLVPAMAEAARTEAFAALSAERVGSELRKALRSPAPGRFVRLLARADALGGWFQELAATRGVPAGPPEHHGDSDVLEHTARTMDALAGDEPACWMALTHDLGKAATPPEKHPAHHGHDLLGAPLAEALGRRLALPNRFLKAGALAARWHMTAARYPELRPGTRVDLLDALHRARLVPELLRLVQADHGQDHAETALADLAAMTAVTLPEAERDKGPESGALLRQMRAQALAGRAKA